MFLWHITAASCESSWITRTDYSVAYIFFRNRFCPDAAHPNTSIFKHIKGHCGSQPHKPEVHRWRGSTRSLTDKSCHRFCFGVSSAAFSDLFSSSPTVLLPLTILLMDSFMRYLSKLEYTAHYKARNQNTVKTNFLRECKCMHAHIHTWYSQ